MKNILTSIMLIFYMTSSANSIENKCNGIKKLSKEYIKYKSLNATIPEEKDPTDLTMEEALILIEKRKEYDKNKKSKKKKKK